MAAPLADLGLPLRDNLGNPSVVCLPLTLRFAPHGKPSKTYRDHKLVLFTAEGDHALMSTEVALAATFAARLYVPRSAATATSLLVRWYASAYDAEDKVFAQEMVAAGGGGGTAIQLVDITGKLQGTLTIVSSPLPFAPLREPRLRPLQAKIIEQARRAGDHVLPSVSIHLGSEVAQVPFLFFSLLASRGMRAPPLRVTLYFAHCLRVATALSADKGADKEQLLADMLTLPTLGWVYRPDVTRAGLEYDQWATSLWSAPGGAPLAFDCEDGSIAMQQLFVVLQTVQLVDAPAELLRMQELARRYTPWLAVNEIKVRRSKYIPHCCLLLLSTAAPPISIESTERCSGPWRNSTAKPPAARLASDSVPISEVRSERMYGRLLTIVSTSNGRAQHFSFPRAVETSAFMCQFGGSAVAAGGQLVADLPIAEFAAECADDLRLIPSPSFPSPPTQCTAAADLSNAESSVVLPGYASSALPSRGATTVAITADSALNVFRKVFD